MPCPIIGSFTSLVLTDYEQRSFLRRDLLTNLEEVLAKSQQEYPTKECLLRRALRAFELGYVAVYTEDLSLLLKLPDVRASFETLPLMMTALLQTQEDVIVSTMESSMIDEKRAARKQLALTKIERTKLGSGVLLTGGQWLLERAHLVSPSEFELMGAVLRDVSKHMTVGLTAQVRYAEELLHT